VDQPLKLGFLASHGGSSMRAIMEAIRAGELRAEPLLVISNNPGSAALEFARSEGLPSRQINASSAGGAEAADQAIADALSAAGVQLVVLSGYMRKLGPATLQRYAGRILNIHPALLPKYGGRGMYGRNVHEAVQASGDAVSGATIHVVEGDYDTGPVVAKREAPLSPQATADQIEAAVRAIEPQFYVDTLRAIAEGRIRLP
jgi:phosphoribosylglycinamide formyltransferase-1